MAISCSAVPPEKITTGGDQSREILTDKQYLPPHRREQIKVQALVDHLAAEQVGENADTAEEDGQAKVIELEDRREDRLIVIQIPRRLEIDAHPVSHRRTQASHPALPSV